jgi:hypothetical protein
MRICYRKSKKGNSKRKRNLPYRKITDAEPLGLLVGELHALGGRYILMITRSNRTALTVSDSNQLNYVRHTAKTTTPIF